MLVEVGYVGVHSVLSLFGVVFVGGVEHGAGKNTHSLEDFNVPRKPPARWKNDPRDIFMGQSIPQVNASPSMPNASLPTAHEPKRLTDQDTTGQEKTHDHFENLNDPHECPAGRCSRSWTLIFWISDFPTV